jgi:dienelactone hydrolase
MPMQNDKPQLWIVSDMWGLENSPWVADYEAKLSPYFTIRLWNVLELAEINISEQKNEQQIHQQLVNKGIDLAAAKLSEVGEVDYAIGFSVGGTTLWKAAHIGLALKQLFVLSSTRLREEQNKPNCKLHLYFGEQDLYQPASSWFTELELHPKIFSGQTHEFYQDTNFASQICQDIIHTLSNN